MLRKWLIVSVLILIAALTVEPCLAAHGLLQTTPATVGVNWDKVVAVSKTSVSIQVCVEPPLRRTSRIHGQLFKALHDLNADYARLQPWYPYPRLSVAELEAPQAEKTSWDFSLLDPIMADFMKASEGHPVDMNISPIPQWMFITKKPVSVPDNPDEIVWGYREGTELRDPSMKEVADYFARVVSWYTRGGFNDENGVWHESDHHFKFDYWEVLNEPDWEHLMTPQFYTALYDAIVAEVRKVVPETKFAGMALAGSTYFNPKWFEYFLSSKNHKLGIPIDMISYHFYASPDSNESPQAQQYTFFAQADAFFTAVRYIELIRKRLSPQTRTYIDEMGAIPASWLDVNNPYSIKYIPSSYWNLSGAVFAYMYANLAGLGVDAVGGAELIDYPGQCAGATLVDWETGQPTARYWVLKLLRDSFGPGDKLIETHVSIPEPVETGPLPPRNYLYAQAFVDASGKRKILLVNKRDWNVRIVLPSIAGAHVEVVDQTPGLNPSRSMQLKGHTIELSGFAVAVVTGAP